jgi:hypothetical protein
MHFFDPFPGGQINLMPPGKGGRNRAFPGNPLRIVSPRRFFPRKPYTPNRKKLENRPIGGSERPFIGRKCKNIAFLGSKTGPFFGLPRVPTFRGGVQIEKFGHFGRFKGRQLYFQSKNSFFGPPNRMQVSGFEVQKSSFLFKNITGAP